MDKIIGITIFSMVLVSFLANPAPVSIEMADVILILFPCFLGFLSLATLKSYKIALPERNMLLAIILYLSYLLISVLIGLMHGVPLLNALRSLGPYINFFPLLLMGLLPRRLLSPWVIAITLIIVGSLQASYLIYLYLTHSYGGTGVAEVLRSRITLIEARTTLPIILSITILPMVLLSSKNKIVKLFATCLIVFGLFAGAATLTRSIVIAIMMGWLTFAILYLHKLSSSPSFSLKKTLNKFLIHLLIAAAIICVISMIPKIYMLEQGILARFYHHGSSATSTDYSNGRLYDEWIPALHTWLNSGALSIFFGMGTGSTFTVATGEERTYIHNLIIYTLVYGGIYGLFGCLWLYFTIFKTLILRAKQSQQTIYLGFAALLISIFSYAQLFAVHKGLAFNAMLFLIITLALCKPDQAKISGD